jgi:hypothetical protein
MENLNPSTNLTANVLQKSRTGIHGLDEIMGSGGSGRGKILLATGFLVRGAVHYDEPGVFMAFEETAQVFHAEERRMVACSRQSVTPTASNNNGSQPRGEVDA